MRRRINSLIIHCSASDWGTAADIRRWHLKRPGFKDIGYHYVIGSGKPYPNCYYYHYLDGSVEVGRRLSVQGAHCKGQNRHSIGICLIGKNSFTQGQMKSLIDVVEHLALQYCLSREQVLPHSAFSRKTCPNFDIGPVVDLAFNTLNR